MKAEDLRASAEELLGERWQSPLSAITGIAPRSVRRMASGAQPVPERLALALDRALKVLDLIAELTAEHGAPGEIVLSGEDDPAIVWARAMVAESLRR